MKDYGPDFLEHTKSALRNISPLSGDYFAEQFDNMPRWNRADLFKEAGAYGGDKLHRTLTNYIAAQQQLYESSDWTYKHFEENIAFREFLTWC
jgi:hypothetical protein